MRRVRSPLNFRAFGCGRIFDAATRSSFRDEITRASTAALIVEFAFVPFCEGVGKFRSVHPRDVLEDCISFTNQLYVAVLDAVVHHFNVMAGAIRSHVSATRFAIHLRGNFAENGCDDFPGFARAAGHERWTFERAFFATGDTAAYKMNSAVL